MRRRQPWPHRSRGLRSPLSSWRLATRRRSRSSSPTRTTPARAHCAQAILDANVAGAPTSSPSTFRGPVPSSSRSRPPFRCLTTGGRHGRWNDAAGLQHRPSSEPEARSASIGWPCPNQVADRPGLRQRPRRRRPVVHRGNDSTLRGSARLGLHRDQRRLHQSNNAAVVLNLIGANAAFGDPGPGLRAGINLLLDGGNNPSVRNNLVGYASTPENVLITDHGGQFLVTGNELVGSLRLSTERFSRPRGRTPTASSGQPDQGLDQLRNRPRRRSREHHDQQQHGAQQRDWRGEYRGYSPDQHGERFLEEQRSRPEHRHRQPGPGHSRYRRFDTRIEAIPSRSTRSFGTAASASIWRRTSDPLTGDGLTLNDPDDPDDGGNELVNFPVIESATVSGNSLIVSGWAGRAHHRVLRGSAGETRDARSSPASSREAPTTSTRPPAATGQDPINGISQGSDTTNRFRFIIPLPAGFAGRERADGHGDRSAASATRRSSAARRRSRSPPM